MDSTEHDYVVVGGGSSGCVLAGELAADRDTRVLVLELGDRAEDHPETLAADGYKKAFINPRLMFERFTVPQPGCAEHRLFAGTGRVVGGSGAINAMVYTRGAAFDFAAWGVDGWRWDDLRPTFEAVERTLRVQRVGPTEFCEAAIAGAEEAGFRRKEDLNDGELAGFLGYEWMNLDVERNERRNGYVAFLRPRLQQGNVTLETGARARRVLFDDAHRAVGVEWDDAAGRHHVARARREVILCAGALETPRLLMLSGVGDAAQLRRHGIEVVADVPAVGENLHDHPNVQVFSLGKKESDSHWAQLYGFHRAHPGGPLAPGEADTCYVFYSARTSFREGMMRLLPGMVLPPSLYRRGWPVRAMRGGIAGLFRVPGVQSFVNRIWGVVVILGKPASRGSVRLASADPHDDALVDPAYFSVESDLETMVHGVKLARRIAASASLRAWGARELMPGPLAQSDEAIGRWVRKNAMTTYHFAGTCRMTTTGREREAVVDARLRVRGVSGLRVADASVVPWTPVSAMNAPSMLVGARAAALIAEEQAHAGGRAREAAR
jgi:choline dehydrogenase